MKRNNFLLQNLHVVSSPLDVAETLDGRQSPMGRLCTVLKNGTSPTPQLVLEKLQGRTLTLNLTL